MTTLIDQLVVKIGLDPKDFAAGTAKVDKSLKTTSGIADKTGKDLKKAGKDGSEGFESLSKTATKFLAVIGGTMAIKRFVEDTIASSSAIDRLSRNINESTETISAWGNVAAANGGSIEGLRGTLDNFSKSATQFKLTGENGLLPYLSALKIGYLGANGQVRSFNDVAFDLADRMAGMDRQTSFNMLQSMGIDEGTANAILKGRGELELLMKRQKEFGAVTKKQAEEASRLNVQIVNSRQSFAAFGRELLSEATPVLEGLFNIFDKIGAWMRENKEFVNDALILMAGGFALLGASLVPINLTAIAIFGLGSAIAALYQDYQTWQKGGESFIDWGKWSANIETVKTGISSFHTYLADKMYRIIAVIDATRAAWAGDWKRMAFAMGEARAGDPNANVGTEAPGATGAASAPGDPLAFFKSKGWSAEQAAGIVANLHTESQMNPAAVGDGGKAYGIAQWHPDRQANFKAWLGRDIKGSSVNDQMEFVNYELTQGTEQAAGKALRGATSASDAGSIVSRRYERPGDKEGEAARRGAKANAMMGIPGAADMAGQGARPSPAAGTGPVISTTIGEVNVHTQATDANGIAKDMGKSMDYLFTAQANYGLT